MPKTSQNVNMKSRPNSRASKFEEASEFEHKLLDVARVARVTAGGRRFSFRVVVVVGDRAGQVGVGVKKGGDVQAAVEKAVRSAKKNMIKAPMTRTGTIPCESYGKSASADVFLRPAAEGKGIIDGGAVRVVCDLAGYKNIVGMILSRSVNKLNNARATVEALRGAKMVSGRSGRVVSAAVTAESSEIVEPAGEEVKI